VVCDRVAQGALDLAREQVGVGAEVALERVLEDHDPVRGAVAGDGRAVRYAR
jgi:hypothetical protein